MRSMLIKGLLGAAAARCEAQGEQVAWTGVLRGERAHGLPSGNSRDADAV